MRWIEVTVETTAEAEEAVANVIMDAGCGGVAVNSSAFQLGANVTGYLPLDDSFENRLNEIRERVNQLKGFGIDIGSGEITVRKVDEEDWATAWKAFFKPLKVGNVVVKPSWEDHTAAEDEIVIQLDPGMAFGTGTHPTTQLCLLALQKYVHGGESVLDMGCGSGILSMVAAKLGAARVKAVDLDPVAVEAAGKNVKDEGLDNKIEVILADKPVGGGYDLVIANIIADTIIRLAGELRDSLKEGGILITSGIIRDRESDVREKLESAGLGTLETMHDGEWTAFVSRRKSDG